MTRGPEKDIIRKEKKEGEGITVIPKPHQIYKHFKGNLYQIMAIAKDSETLEDVVVYQAMYGDFQIYVRPLSMFVSKVDKEKYPNATQEYRFELQGAPVAETVKEPVEEPDLDPELLEFLDADTPAQKLNILNALSTRLTDQMLTIMAVSCDVEIGEGSLEKRFDELKTCLQTLEKYEIRR